MKRIIAFVTVVIFFSLALFAFAAELPPVTVTLDGQVVDCDSYGQEATIVEGRTLVPLRAIFEALGASVEWDAKNYVVTSTLNEITIRLRIGENFLLKNGQAIMLDVPAMLMNDRTMIPVRAVTEAFGMKVDWIDETRTVVLLTGKYKRGIRSDKVYYGEWLNFNYYIPEDCVFADEIILFEEMGVVSDVNNDMDFSLLSYVYEFEVSDENGNMLSVVCEKNEEGKTVQEYLREAVKVYELSGLEAKVGEIYKTDKGFAVKVQSAYLGVEFTQEIEAYEKDERIVSFVYTYTDGKAKEKLKSGFEEYKKPSGDIVVDTKYKETDVKNEFPKSDVKKHHAYGRFNLGMTMTEAKNVINGEIIEKNDGKTINIFDKENVFDDEDINITSDANCDLISLIFSNGVLSHVYVSTEYMTLNEAKRIRESVISYYGKPEYVYETTEGFYDTYFWSAGNVCADCTIVYEEKHGYSCVLEIYVVE